MRLVLTIVFAAMFLAIGIVGAVFEPAELAPLSPAVEAKADAARLPEVVYDGWRASKLLGSAVFSLKGEYLGEVRNALVADDGQINALLVEGGATGEAPAFVFRIPWLRIVHPLHTGALIADFSNLQSREYGLFFDPERTKDHSQVFPITKVLGDYARLQTGQGYGYVSDLVFNQSGRWIAVLVSRDASAGGGTYAFAYPGASGKWSAEMSYYGLPYVTEDQAAKAGLRIDVQRFQAPS